MTYKWTGYLSPAVIYIPSPNHGGRRVLRHIALQQFERLLSRQYPQRFYHQTVQTHRLNGRMGGGVDRNQFPPLHNVTEPFNRILYSGNGSLRNVKTFNIPPGYYHDLKELFLTMHEMMDELGQQNIKLTLNKNTQKVKVKLDGGAFIEFRAELAAMLGFVGKGFEKLVSVRHLNTHDAELPNAGMYSLYLYSDIVEDQLIGDVFAPLLRIVHGKDRVKGRDIITRTYKNPHFVKVKMKRFDTIDMHIRRDTGEKI